MGPPQPFRPTGQLGLGGAIRDAGHGPDRRHPDPVLIVPPVPVTESVIPTIDCEDFDVAVWVTPHVFERIADDLSDPHSRCQKALERDPGSACNWGSGAISMQVGSLCADQPSFKQVEFGPAEHLPLHKLQAGDLPLRLAVRP